MKAGAAIASLSGLLLLGLGLRMVGSSFDPEIMTRTEAIVIEFEAESFEERTSGTRLIGFVLLGVSAFPLGIAIVIYSLKGERDSRIPVSILCLLAAVGFGAVAYEAFRHPATPWAFKALFGVGSLALWIWSGLQLVPLLQGEEDAPTSAS